jgi:lipopolysaccharide transport system ATP-binding protein
MIDRDSGYQFAELRGLEVFSVCLPDVRLYPGMYSIGLYVGDPTTNTPYDHASQCHTFQIVDGGTMTTRHLPRSAGLFFWTPKWERLMPLVPERAADGSCVPA